MTVEYRIEEPDSVRDMASVLILAGEYAGVRLAYGELKFLETNSGPKIEYIYQVYDNPMGKNTQDAAFKKTIDWILDDVLDKAFTRVDNG